jgi:hypothetical protein
MKWELREKHKKAKPGQNGVSKFINSQSRASARMYSGRHSGKKSE